MAKIKDIVERFSKYIKEFIEDIAYAIWDIVLAMVRFSKLLLAPLAGYLSGIMHLSVVTKLKDIMPDLTPKYVISAVICLLVSVFMGYVARTYYLNHNISVVEKW
jgi:sorbitol-specific phosphotransferase system component IIBC